MSYDRDSVLKDMRSYIAEVTFTKADGSNRLMRCTLDPKYLPKTYLEEADKEKTFHADNPDVITAWDLHNGGWRSFRIDSVQYIQIIDGDY